MATGFFRWSRTAADNATATYTWAEGMAPSSVNDSARGIMSDAAQYRDDISGAIVTGGTSTSYTVTTFQTFDTLAHLDGQLVAFTPHATNGATVVLNVDGLGAKPLRPSPGVELQAGTLILGTPYTALYNHSDQVFYLHGLYGNPYNVPLMGGMDYWDTVAPNSSFIFPAGQAISRTTYSAVFARWGTTYGVGDGSTTFNVPDKTERVSVMKASSATRLTSTYFGGDSTAMGAVGGDEKTALVAANIPSLNSSGNNSISVQSANYLLGNTTTNSGSAVGGGTQLTAADAGSGAIIQKQTSTGSNSISVSYTNGSQTSPRTVQPTIVCNYIIRII